MITDDDAASGSSETAFELRRRVPSKRHNIAWASLDRATSARVDALLDEIERIVRRVQSIGFGAAVAVHSVGPEVEDGIVAQLLVDEAAERIELERASQLVDGYSAWPGPKRGLPGRADVIPFTPIRSSSDVRPGILSRCGDGFSWEVAARGAADDWRALTLMQRAWVVNNVVLDLLESAPDRVSVVDLDDLESAASGGPSAWERLRSSCGVAGGAAVPKDEEIALDPGRPARKLARTRGRPGRPAGGGLFRSDDHAREALTEAVRECSTPDKPATKDRVIEFLEKRLDRPVTEDAIDYWAKKRLGYSDWPSFRDGCQ